MEIRPKTLTPAVPGRRALGGPPPQSDQVERGRTEETGTYGPNFARKVDLTGAEAPSRAGLKAAGMALAVVVVAALCDTLTGGALHRSRD